uniref:Uncharacterized protein n=1 Tax=Emiliania huxleyi TaxID=2903 RepID=A0A7S3T9S5_EMIHU
MTHNLPAAMLALAPLVAVMAAPDFGPRFAPTHKDNMNGAYPFSATPGGTPGKMPKRFSDYPHGVESFDVHTSEMSTLYSQVWWKPHPPAALPKEIVAKYNGSRMAIVGWEIDQVQRTADGDVSVPISASYNHHYVSQLVGAGARLRQVKLDGPHDPRAKELMHASHGHVNWEQPQWIAEDVVEAAGGEGREAAAQSTRQWFSSGNGGEYRKTYHGFAPGYAMVVDSPTHLQMAPMQIDTWNREAMDISARRQGPVRFVPGPQPRASLAPADAAHSGLLECPMTTRLTKVVDGAYAVHANASSCAEPILTYHECFEAARKVFTHVVSVSNASGADARRPVGCSAALRPSSASVSVFFNEMASPPTACSVAHQCVCPVAPKPFGQATGALRYHPTSQPADVGRGFAARFGGGGKSCAAWPSTDLIEHRNPTCDIRHYQGGQWACNHGWSLLDAEQQIPWADRPLVFVHKFRFYVQPYVPAYHTPIRLGETAGSALLLGSPWEYDVPRCAEGVPGCSRDAHGMWVHKVVGKHVGKHTFVALNNHCHAPTCLAMEVYACAKGTPLEACDTTAGKLVCRTAPVYGGTGSPTEQGSRFDEAGYIAIPDCFWGGAEWGLEPPQQLDGVPLHIVKTCNATLGHYGEMAGGQPWVYS